MSKCEHIYDAEGVCHCGVRRVDVCRVFSSGHHNFAGRIICVACGAPKTTNLVREWFEEKGLLTPTEDWEVCYAEVTS